MLLCAKWTRILTVGLMLVFANSLFGGIKDDLKLVDALLDKKDSINLMKELKYHIDSMKDNYPNNKVECAVAEGRYLYRIGRKSSARKVFVL